MVSNLSGFLANKLLFSSNMSKEQRELYEYGLFILMSKLIFFVLACFFGLLFGCLIESAIFYVTFMAIRQFAGGYHASTENRCEIMSTALFFICTAIIKLLKIYGFENAIAIATVVAALCIFLISPVDTPEKPLSDNEYNYYRKVSWLILLIILAIGLVSYILKLKLFFIPACLSLILESFLLIIGKMKKRFAN